VSVNKVMTDKNRVKMVICVRQQGRDGQKTSENGDLCPSAGL
jgi:hypothetical protein